jgi:RNA polymerase sigma-70 factor (ECF subfamily)
VHADAATFHATDWSQIVALYDQLLAVAPTPVVALNRAVAVAELDGPGTALELVDRLAPELDGYHAFYATRADLLWRLGRSGEAEAAFERAAELAPSDAEREFLRHGGRSGTGTGSAWCPAPARASAFVRVGWGRGSRGRPPG